MAMEFWKLWHWLLGYDYILLKVVYDSHRVCRVRYMPADGRAYVYRLSHCGDIVFLDDLRRGDDYVCLTMPPEAED